MARALSLHPLNALDARPIQLIEIAGRLGVGLVCLFTYVPAEAAGRYPLVAPADVAAVGDALAQAGVRLCNLEVFPLDRDGDLDRFAAGLEVGAALGASKATAHIHDAHSEQNAIDRFGAFADLAARHGIVAGLEFHNFSGVKDVASAARIVRGAGRGSLVLDALHLIRGGGSAADAAGVADLVGYAQLSDGPLELPAERRWHEAVVERLLPGEGSFPLGEILRPLRADTVFEVEVPQTAARKAGASPLERARRSVETAARVLVALDEGVPA